MCIEFHRAGILIWVPGRAMEGPRIRCRWCEERVRAPRQEHKFIDCLWTPPASHRAARFGIRRARPHSVRDHCLRGEEKTFPTRACTTGARTGKCSWTPEKIAVA